MTPLITRWDLDKTYLRSDFASLSDLARSVLERPDQKRAVPGAATLLRQMCAYAERVHILSGSPRQLRRALLQRLHMDGVRVDTLTLKPNASNLLRLRLAALHDQLGYKLTALLETKKDELRNHTGPPPTEVLLGDDSEADAFIYSLYADLCLGVVDPDELESILKTGGTYPDLIRRALRAATGLAETAHSTTFRILVHLDRQTPPSEFAGYGERLIAFHNYVQASLLLVDWGFTDVESFYDLCLEMILQHGMNLDALVSSYRDLRRRGKLSPSALTAIEEGPPALIEDVALLRPLLRMAESEESTPNREPPLPTPGVDYFELARLHQGGKSRR